MRQDFDSVMIEKTCSRNRFFFFLRPFPHWVRGIVGIRREVPPLNFTAVLLPRFQANKLIAEPHPPVFWNDDAHDNEIRQIGHARLGRRSTFVNKQKVHGAMKSEKPQESQRERFEQAARELGVELDEEKLKEALRKIGGSRPPPEEVVNPKDRKPDH